MSRCQCWSGKIRRAMFECLDIFAPLFVVPLLRCASFLFSCINSITNGIFYVFRCDAEMTATFGDCCWRFSSFSLQLQFKLKHLSIAQVLAAFDINLNNERLAIMPIYTRVVFYIAWNSFWRLKIIQFLLVLIDVSIGACLILAPLRNNLMGNQEFRQDSYS